MHILEEKPWMVRMRGLIERVAAQLSAREKLCVRNNPKESSNQYEKLITQITKRSNLFKEIVRLKCHFWHYDNCM
jgi:hypothetical protein